MLLLTTLKPTFNKGTLKEKEMLRFGGGGGGGGGGGEVREYDVELKVGVPPEKS